MQHVTVLKERLEGNLLKLNNWLVLRSTKNTSEKTNKLLKEAEVFEKKQKWIELILEIIILPYYLHKILEFSLEYYFKEKLIVVENGSFWGMIIGTSCLLLWTVSRLISRSGTENEEKKGGR